MYGACGICTPKVRLVLLYRHVLNDCGPQFAGHCTAPEYVQSDADSALVLHPVRPCAAFLHRGQYSFLTCRSLEPAHSLPRHENMRQVVNTTEAREESEGWKLYLVQVQCIL
jgi:hypothetical protein